MKVTDQGLTRGVPVKVRGQLLEHTRATQCRQHPVEVVSVNNQVYERTTVACTTSVNQVAATSVVCKRDGKDRAAGNLRIQDSIGMMLIELSCVSQTIVIE